MISDCETGNPAEGWESAGQMRIADLKARSRSDGFRLGGVHPTYKALSLNTYRGWKAAPTVKDSGYGQPSLLD